MEDISSIFKSLDYLYYECAKKSGMAETAFFIIMAVREKNAGCTQTDICERWTMSRQTVNSALKKLEKDGFLILTPAETGKRKIIELTRKGIKYSEIYIDPVFEFEKAAWISLSKEKQKVFLDIAKEYHMAFKNAMERSEAK